MERKSPETLVTIELSGHSNATQVLLNTKISPLKKLAPNISKDGILIWIGWQKRG